MTGELYWGQPKVEGEYPTARSGHTLTFVKNKIVLFGGTGEKGGKGQALNDVYILSLGITPIWAKGQIAGVAPSPRARHSASVFDSSKILIFGGVHAGKRNNDLYVLDIDTMSWSQQKADGALPSPRAHHTCTCVGKSAFLFGGYGGEGRGKKFLGDFYVLDLDSKTWSKPNVQGTAPCARADHTCSVVDVREDGSARLVFFGGRDLSHYYDDMHVFDVATMSWSVPEGSLGKEWPAHSYKLASHVAIGVESVPNYKVFAFGGQSLKGDDRTKWDFKNSVSVLDTGSMIWSTPTVLLAEGCDEGPMARDETDFAYDPKSCKLFMFGGWARQWLGDMYTLDVAGIIGPPYAVFSLEPPMGPVTGGTTIIIRGMNFFEADVTVKFVRPSGKEEATAKGTYISDTEVSVATPDFSQFGAGDVDVRVQLRGELFTVNRVKFMYFDDTKADKCLAYGPGLLKAYSKVVASFLITARDSTDHNRTSGGDRFVVKVRNTKTDAIVDGDVVDTGSGIYKVFYAVPSEGQYEINVYLVGKKTEDMSEEPLEPIRGSPMTIEVEDPSMKPRHKGLVPRIGSDSTMNYVVTAKKLLIFGVRTMRDEDGVASYANYLHILDLETWKWSSPGVNGDFPPQLVGFTVSDMNGKIIVFGGQTQENDLETAQNAIFVLSEDKGTGDWSWNQVETRGNAPLARANHLACVDGRNLVIFGGEAMSDVEIVEETSDGHEEKGASDEAETDVKEKSVKTERRRTFLNDVAILRVEASKYEWKEVDIEGEPPKPRSRAAGTVHQKNLYIFGGESKKDDGEDEDETEFLDDVQVLAMDGTYRWEAPNVPGLHPEARADASAFVLRDEVYVRGGTSADERPLDDLFVLSPSTMTWSRAVAASEAPMGGRSQQRPAFIVENSLYSLNPRDIGDISVLDISDKLLNESFVPKMGSIIKEGVAEIEKKMRELQASIELKVSGENFDTLLKVMNALYTTKVNGGDIEVQFECLRETLHYLKDHLSGSGFHGTNIPTLNNLEKRVDESKSMWNNIKKVSGSVKKSVKPMIENEGNRIRGEVQTFTDSAKRFNSAFSDRAFFKDQIEANSAYDEIVQANEDLREQEKRAAELQRLANVFEFPQSMKEAHANVDECRKLIYMMKNVWDIYAYMDSFIVTWKATLWQDVNCEAMDDQMKEIVRTIRAVPKRVKDFPAFRSLDTAAKNFMTSIPLVNDLHHPSMRDRHWKQLMEATGKDIAIHDEKFSLADLLALELHKFEDEVNDIVDRAQKEEKMEAVLVKLDATWKELQFSFSKHKDTDIQTVKVSEEDFETLEDNQVVVQNTLASRYVAHFQTEFSVWQKKLGMVAEVLAVISEVQRTWAYLETLFIGSDEVKRELPEDTERFANIDVKVKEILKEAAEIKNLLSFCNKDGLLDSLEKLQQDLELCEKALADYLEGKRRAFPRFFFVSTADLLEILSNGKEPPKVMKHMPKTFQAIKTLNLKEENGVHYGVTMVSSVGIEQVDFREPVPLSDAVEVWCQRVIDYMRSTLKAILKDSISNYAKPSREEWLFNFPAQLMLVTSNIFFTQEVFDAFAQLEKGDKMALKNYNKKQIEQLTNLIKMVQGDLKKPDRMKVMNMITMDTHSRDVIQTIIKDKVSHSDAFAWQSQLKQRWDESEEDCFTNIADAEFRYGFEYLGNGPRLVVTPLTDRLYITATQAAHLCLGTAPAGPAGTGKTETTKDLAAQLGLAVYVFNCAPEMDYRSMGDIFKGLGASGSWGCFDEFNRLVAEVLSVCSVQWKSIVDALRNKAKTFNMQGTIMDLIPTVSAFITMNPGYLGRTELPESLKVLFRPVTVMVPDLELICENMLMAQGFIDAKVLARKFTMLYALSKDLLSKQTHYDWGLRAIKSILVVAGSFKRGEPDVPEEDLLMRALRDGNLPKIVGDDLVVYMGLLKDIFPTSDIPRKRDYQFEDLVRQTCVENNLQSDEDFVMKIVQLQELLDIRHCVFIMGTSGIGKSCVWRMLANAWTKDGRKTTCVDINPKAVTTEEFYGNVNLTTREWKDGLMSKFMRDLATAPDSNPKWIILDGDLDANWIESMNSVMDDNKLLTLPSNERIQLLPHMRLIFELRDLRFASPATCSRAGILYLSDDVNVSWPSYVKSWVAMKMAQDKEIGGAKFDPEPRAKALQSLFDKYVEKTIKAWKKSFKSLVSNQVEFNMVQTLCAFLGSLIDVKTAIDEYENLFVFAAVWAFGGALSIKDGKNYRRDFSEWWKKTFTAVKFKGKGAVFDFYYDPKTKKQTPWSELVTAVPFSSAEQSMNAVTIPTPETVAVSYWVDLLVKLRKPAMLVGLAGCGKTAIIKGVLKSLSADDFLTLTININYFTEANILQKTLEQPLEKKAGRTYGPPGNKKLVYFVDDLNLGQVDPYDTNTGISLMRQHIDYGHWYDKQKIAVKDIANTQYVAAMNPTAGTFIINPRLQRHFGTFAIGFPGQESLMTIYSTYLQGHLKNGFDPKVVELNNKVIQCAMELQSRVESTFRKTAKKFHYEFTVRHIHNVFQGILMASSEQFNDPVKFVRMSFHEAERVYGDRLVSPKDLTNYQKLAKETAKKHFKEMSLEDIFPSVHIFCHFAKGIGEPIYDQVSTFEDLNNTLVEGLAEYNEIYPVMNLVLFEDAMCHVARISRIIQTGHALLVGVGGSGKRSLARLAAHISQYLTVAITISKTYNVNDLKADFATFYKRAGLKNEKLMFLFTDSQITNEQFLIYMNDLLASGNIPDLFSPEDKDTIINSVRSEVKMAGIIDTNENCWDFFIEKVVTNLHVVLCFSPVGEDMRKRCTRFPALVNCTVIDWFQPWPEEALQSVSKRFLAEVELDSEQLRDAIMNFMPFSFQAVNEASERYLEQEKRYNYTTPKSFLELINLYKSKLAQRRDRQAKLIDRLQSGLSKLRDTAKAVALLEEDLKVKSVEVEEKKNAANELMERCSKERDVVSAEAAKAEEEALKCAEIAKEVSQKQEDCERDLAAAEPLVEEAQKALDTLNKKDLGELKSLAKPPAGVDLITNAILVMFSTKGNLIKEKERTWDAAKKMMSNVDQFLKALLEFKDKLDKTLEDNTRNPGSGEIPLVNFKAVRVYLADEQFTPETMEKKSKAAAGLSSWVINVVKYFDVVSTVEPKRKALSDAKDALQAANEQLSAVEAKVKQLQEELASLEKELASAVEEKEKCIAEAEMCQKKLGLAQRLVNGLASENERWALGIEELTNEAERLPGDVLIASAFLSYVGAFNRQFREELINQKFLPFLVSNNIPTSENADPLKILTDDAEIAGWQNDGLPADRVSTENGVICVNADRWPLMIDPQLQGVAWIKERETKRNQLNVVRLSQKKYLDSIERCLENGYSVLIESIGESIDAVLGPIISRQFVKRGRNILVKVGDKDTEVHPNFRLYFQTKLSNPHYPPEIQAECTLINFAVTEDGLEDQLLALTVKKERPDLEEKKTELIVQQNEFKIRLKELEDSLLKKLSEAEGDITEDVELIEGLEQTKKISLDIQEKVAAAKETEKTINEAREGYRPVAIRGSLLFFLLNQLFKINQMYHYSLNAFVIVFDRAIDTAGGRKRKGSVTSTGGGSLLLSAVGTASRLKRAAALAASGGSQQGEGFGSAVEAAAERAKELEAKSDPEVLKKRIAELLDSVTYQVFNYTRRGLFESHKLIVATQLALRILQNQGVLNSAENEFLVMGKRNMNPPPLTAGLEGWVSEAAWQSLCALKEIPAFSTLPEDMEGSKMDDWREWMDDPKAELREMPGNWKEKSQFQKLCIIRALRPDRIPQALAMWVRQELGDKYIEQDAFNMAEAYSESGPPTPMFFILFPGTDIMKDIEAQAKRVGVSEESGSLVNISMGQGQESPAEKALDQMTKEGGWVVLQNVHLMQNWLPTLERKLEIAAESGHEKFRCFLSGEPPPLSYIRNIPESILQSSIKIANEPPKDLKSNLRRAFANFNQEFMDKSTKPDKFRPCLFALSFFHAIMLGRRKFGFAGFSRAYAFNTGDLTICADVLHNYVEGNDQVPWDDIRYIFGEVMYGGHITDKWDRRVNVAYLVEYLKKELFEQCELAPGFNAPADGDYEHYRAYIEEAMPVETPPMYGLHPNAEISLLTMEGNTLFETVMMLSGVGGGGSRAGAGTQSPEDRAKQILESMLEELDTKAPGFNMMEVRERVEEKTPYVVVVLQEVERMNRLLSEMRRSLIELKMGLEGQLNISEAMESLANSLIMNQLPSSWAVSPQGLGLSYFSLKNLSAWFIDLLTRVAHLTRWSNNIMQLPASVWFSSLFNPMAFLTAVMQTKARRDKYPLDKMALQTDVTNRMYSEPALGDAASQQPDPSAAMGLTLPDDGVQIHGLFIEGARWDRKSGTIKDAILKDLHPPMPVIHVKAIMAEEKEKRSKGYYECPVYYTSVRGGTFVFSGQLKMDPKDSETKWILGGVCLLLQDD